MKPKFTWPLMQDNITKGDRRALIHFLEKDEVLTQSKQVEAFEKEWSDWLGVKYSVLVNSGASANLLSMHVLREVYGRGQVIVPALTWVSDIASIFQAGLKPVFVDINPQTLGLDSEKVLKHLGMNTIGVFLTHLLGFNALDTTLLQELKKRKIPLIEDCCEAHGATFKGRKVGTFGLMSNFSFYYAHHMTTIEGGMISTNDFKVYDMCRMMRSHGLLRESKDEALKKKMLLSQPSLNSQFVFMYPAYNVRSTELNAVLGRNQLKRLDANNKKRHKNFEIFLKHLNPSFYATDFKTEGSVNYAFAVVLQKALNAKERSIAIEEALKENGVEFRRGLAGGGNQLRQPYLKRISLYSDNVWHYPNTEHVHWYGWYVGNYPDLKKERIVWLADVLNAAIKI